MSNRTKVAFSAAVALVAMVAIAAGVVVGMSRSPSAHPRMAATAPTNVMLSSGVALFDPAGKNAADVLDAGAPPQLGNNPLAVTQVPQSNCPDQAAIVGDAATAGTANITLDASFSTGYARRLWVATGGTVCVQHANDSACVCYGSVPSGSYMDGVFAVVCGTTAGTTASGIVAER
jgi:hypothetical protein